jgi:hypothetical protein
MAYTKLTLEVVVAKEDLEVLEHALHNALEKLEGHVTVYSTEIETEATDEPENAAEIGATVDGYPDFGYRNPARAQR